MDMLKDSKNNRLLIALALILILAFLATTLISFYAASNSVRNSIIDQQLPMTGDNIYSEIQRDLIGPINVSAQMANDTFLRQWVLDGEQDPKKITQYLSEVKQKFNADTAFLVTENKRNYWNNQGFLKKISHQDTEDAWYFRVQKMQAAFEVNVDIDKANDNRLTVFVNYRVSDFNSQYIGITGVGIAFKSLRQLIDNYENKFHRTVFFLDGAGHVVVSGSKYSHDVLESNIKAIRHQLLNASVSQTKLSYRSGGATYQLNSRFIPQVKWYLVVQESEADAVTPFKRVLMTNLLISFIATLLVVTMIFYLMRGYQKRIERTAHTDKLSSLANREMGDIQLEMAMQHAVRSHEKLSMVLIDLDHFKQINDRYGHLAGDQVIREFSMLLKEHVRLSDVISRWGGEEFLVTLVETGLSDAILWCEKLRTALQNHPFQFNGEAVAITASFGVVQLQDNQTKEALFSQVDQAMYQAKVQGRNRVVS